MTNELKKGRTVFWTIIGGLLIISTVIGLIYQQPYTYNAKLTLTVWMLFHGVYLLSSRQYTAIPRRMFYINIFSIFSMYIVMLFFLYPRFGSILIWKLHKPVLFDLSKLFAVLPGNNLSFFSHYSPNWLNEIFRIIYNTGYFTPVLFPVCSNIFQNKFKRVWQYFLSAHFLQLFLIMPFYMIFSVQEVWYVTGIPDGLLRVFPSDAIRDFTVSYCFPSMHTSIAMASFLVARQEPSKLFRYAWCSYCIAIIISTLWFPIHWTLDVVGGAALGYAAVWLVNIILESDLLNKVMLLLHLKTDHRSGRSC